THRRSLPADGHGPCARPRETGEFPATRVLGAARGRFTPVMSFHRPPRRAALALFLAAGTAGLLWTKASADEPLLAKSVCGAQELRARLAAGPGLAIQIPPEFDKA